MREFGSVFAADMETERVPFTIEGREGFVALRKMSFGSRSQYDATGMKFDDKGKITEIDNERRACFLVSRTVVDYRLWLRPFNPDTQQPGDLQAVEPPETKKQRELWLEKNLPELDGEFGSWLHDLCLGTNGLRTDQAKNSETPSND